MKQNRRQFARLLALGAAAPIAVTPQGRGGRGGAANPEQPPVPQDAVDARMKLLSGIPMNAERTQQVRQSIEQSLRQADKIREYNLPRPVEPTLSLGMMLANGSVSRGGRRAG